MTSIDKLQISGIRSFNPNLAERQVIEFHKPLTVILGKNGAGKTTIIEALLNACSGEMPPGAAGAEKCSFIYDPKIVGETEVKGQIRLTFTARGGQAMQVIRSFQATVSKTRTSFSTLDSTLAFKEEATGKIKSGTYRCSDVDRMVPELLGVSKAVLEHVVFCHQEEANWPLGAPSEVKRIFDDIFASTRYVAALDKLRESSKEYKSQQRQNESIIIALKEHREQARTLKAEVDGKEESIRLLNMRNKEIEPQIDKLGAAIASLDSVSHNADSLVREMDVVRGRVDEKQRVLRLFNLPATKQTLEELQQLDRNFDTHMAKLTDEVAKKTSQTEQTEAERVQVQNRLGEAQAQHRMAQSEDTEHKRRVRELQNVISGISTEFVAGEGAMDESALLGAEEKVKQKAQTARHQRNLTLDKHEKGMAEIRKNHDQISRAIDAGSQEKQMKEAHLVQLQQRYTEMQRSLPAQGQDPTAAVVALTQEVEGLKQAIATFAQKRREGTGYKRAEELVNKIQLLNSKVTTLHKEMHDLKKSGEDMSRIKYLQEQIAEKQSEAENLLAEQVIPLLTGAGGALPKNNKNAGAVASMTQVQASWEQLKQKKAQSLAQCEQDHRETDLQVNMLVQQLSSKQTDLRQRMDKLQQSKAVCVSVLGSEAAIADYASLLQTAEEKQAKRQRQITSIESMGKSYESFIASAKNDKHCVVCQRPLNEAELKDFININEKRQKSTPQQLEKANVDMTQSAQLLEKYRRIEPTVREVANLQDQIPKLQQELSGLENQLKEKKAYSADVATKKRELVKQDAQVDTIRAELVKVTAILDNVKSMATTVAHEEAKITASLPHGGASAHSLASQRNLQVVEAELDECNSELHEGNKELHQLQAQGGAGGSGPGAGDEENMKQRLLDKQNQLIDATLQSKRHEDLVKGMGLLDKEIAVLKARFTELGTQRAKLQVELDASSAKLRATQDAFNTKDHATLNEVHKLEQDCNTLNSSSVQVRNYIQSHGATKLATLKQNEKVLQEELTKKEQLGTKLRGEIQDKRKVLDEQHQRFAQIQQHIQHLQQQQDLDRDKLSLTNLEKKLVELKATQIQQVESILGADFQNQGGGGGHGTNLSFSRTRDLCQAKIAELQQVRATHQGSLETMMRDVAERRGHLAKDKYRDIDKRYTSTFIKVQTTELAVQDIEKYYRALEKAVSTYHQEKIAQINAIIAELWRQTYRGSDVDTIEVRSEDETSGTISKRSYKYRVVMRRGDRELDMRGRCSAGQKVLASVIIRLALSEAFCCDCGILALDEPTTNLDEDNARSLAEALKELISQRRSIKHFQLIVITHDEGFVRALGGQHNDHFYFVQKDREGAFSTIGRRRYGDLFA